MLPKISVCIPTVTGREDYLGRCVDSYTKWAPGNYELELCVEWNHPSCGAGWWAASERCHGEYIHLTCDDIEALEGWSLPAVADCDEGWLPAPQVYGPTGQPQSLPVVGWVAPDKTPVKMTALPFMSRAQYDRIRPLFTAHYFTDDYVSARGEWLGIQTRLRTGYAFMHWWAQVKRGAGFATDSERMTHDQALFNECLRRIRAGEWTEAWPPNGGLPE
jgi:hypothetical protein